MSKVFFIGVGFLVSACGVSDGIKGAKGSKRQEGYEGHDNSDLSDSKEKPIHEEPKEKKRRERQNLFFIDKNDNRSNKFSLVNNSGSILLKIPVKEGEIYKRINFPSSRVAFVQENNKFYVVLANERINRGVKAKNYEGTRCDFLDLYRQKSEEVTISELTEGVWEKIQTILQGYNATLNTSYSSEDGLTVYTFRSNPTKEHKDKQKKFDKNYQNKSKANKNITLENDEYAKLFKILPKTFFIRINGLYNNEDLEKCLQYMKEEIVLDEYLLTLLDKKIKEEICRAEILVKICEYLNCDLSFVSSICNNGGYEELKKAFEKLTNVEFLKIIKNLLDKKDKDNNEILKINNLSAICNSRGFSDFKKLVDWLDIPENLDKIKGLKNFDIRFLNLSSICNHKGFDEFKKLVEWLSKSANLNIISALKEKCIVFVDNSSQCVNKGLQGLKNHLWAKYSVEINESACGVADGVLSAKKIECKIEDHSDDDNSDISGSKEKSIHKYDTKKKTTKRQDFYYLINNDECKFVLVNSLGTLLLRRDVKDGNKRKPISYSCSRVAFIEDSGEVYVVLANEGVRRVAKAKNDEEMEIDFSDLYTKKSEYATIGKVPRHVWAKIREKLLEYNATLNTYSGGDGLTVYTFRSNPTKEQRERQKELTLKSKEKSKDIKSSTLTGEKYAELLEILPKTIFTSINGLSSNEDLEKCLEYMNEKILVGEYLLKLLGKEIEEATCRAEILVGICRYLNCDSSFVSSICVNNGYKELEKAFEELINVEFLEIIKNLLDKKDKDNNEILKINNLSAICNSRGFSDFKKLVDWLSISANSEKIEKLGIAFYNLSSICSGRGFSDFEKLVNWLSISANSEKIEKLGIACHNLSSICNGRGFSDFKKLVDYLDITEILDKIKALKKNGIAFESLSSICKGKGFDKFKKLVEWLDIPANLEKIEKLKNSGIAFESLSSICSCRGYSDFEKLVDYLNIPESLDKIEKLKNNGVALFRNLSSICHGKGFDEFKELVGWLYIPENLDKIKALKRSGISFHNLSCCCRRRGLDGVRKYLAEHYRVEINEEDENENIESKDDYIKYSLETTECSKREKLREKKARKGTIYEEISRNSSEIRNMRRVNDEKKGGDEKIGKLFRNYIELKNTIKKEGLKIQSEDRSLEARVLGLLKAHSYQKSIFVDCKIKSIESVGKGLFVQNTKLNKNDIIGIYSGKIVQSKSLKRDANIHSWMLDKAFDDCKKCKYSVCADDENIDMLRWINSSPEKSDLNVKAVLIELDGIPLWVYLATKTINSGEQLLVDYRSGNGLCSYSEIFMKNALSAKEMKIRIVNNVLSINKV